MTAGVYTITSPSGRRYVGSAVDFGARWSVHRHHLSRGATRSDAARAAMAAAQRGKTQSLETIKKRLATIAANRAAAS